MVDRPGARAGIDERQARVASGIVIAPGEGAAGVGARRERFGFRRNRAGNAHARQSDRLTRRQRA